MIGEKGGKKKLLPEKQHITICDEPELDTTQTHIVDIELDVLGEKTTFSVFADQEQAGLADIVPLARSLSEKVTDIIIKKITKTKPISPAKKDVTPVAAISYQSQYRKHYDSEKKSPKNHSRNEKPYYANVSWPHGEY